MVAIWDFIQLLFATVADVILLQAPAAVIGSEDRRWAVAVAIAVVSALSGLLGNAGLLAINRVRGFGIVITWGLVSLQTMVALVFQALVLWLSARAILDHGPDIGTVVRIVLLSTAPHWFAFLSITPFLGPLVERVLWAWTLATLWALMLYVGPGASSGWLVLLVVVVGWLASRLVATLLNPPVQWVRRTVWRTIMRRPLRSSARELLEAATPQVLASQHAPPTPEADAGHVLLGHRASEFEDEGSVR